MQERSASAPDLGYRYGFNGMEEDDEVSGDGNSLDFGARIYNSRLGRWLSLDPLAIKFPYESNYVYTSCNPIYYSDKDGEFKISEATTAAYPNLKPAIKVLNDKINAMEADDPILVALLKYGEFENKEELLAIFKDGEGPNLQSGDHVKLEIKYGIEKTSYIPKAGEDGGPANGMTSGTETITIDDNILYLVEIMDNPDVSDEYKAGILLLFESTLLHEVVHVGDHKDGVLASAEGAGKEAGVAFEKDAYGEDVEWYNTGSPEVKSFYMTNLGTPPASTEAESDDGGEDSSSGEDTGSED